MHEKKEGQKSTPQNDQERWILGSYAIWAQFFGQFDYKGRLCAPNTTDSPLYIGGRPKDEDSRKRTIKVLKRDWDIKNRDELLRKLVELQYERNDMNFVRNKFRVRGDVVEVYPAYSADSAYRVEFFGDEVDRIAEINTVTGEVKNFISHLAIYPASHYIVPRERILEAVQEIRQECDQRVEWFRQEGKLIEAQRIAERTNYDMEMLLEIGFCKGIENYSRVLAGREPGSTPCTLMDYFPDDFLMFIDESHVTLPQVRGMFGGDRSRKENLIQFGFRLPSALDNRPLNFDEFNGKINQVLYVSATPGPLERQNGAPVVEQIIRPTGLLDPEISGFDSPAQEPGQDAPYGALDLIETLPQDVGGERKEEGQL